jgi:light-regulated signal transduction histidine kinase (bacteriophytochrome)
MNPYDILRAAAPVPTVDLKEIRLPQGGIAKQLPQLCSQKFTKGDQCRRHYQQMLDGPADLVQCPFGLASLRVSIGDRQIALTSFVPFPRLGGDSERRAAKHLKDHRIPVEALREAGRQLSAAASQIVAREAEAEKELATRASALSEREAEFEKAMLNRQSVAMHEMRKLNGIVKQEAERICRNSRPDDPDSAAPEFVRIWKTSEMMSQQFDIIELLGNEGLLSLPLKTRAEIYRVFDKCARVYRAAAKDRRIQLRSTGSARSSIAACDKTLPIIPTVLIENAIRYGLPNTDIDIVIEDGPTGSRVSVSNWTRTVSGLDSSLFDKGVRASQEKDGSGHGLYVAQLVAKQHNTEIALQVMRDGARAHVTFSVEFHAT